MQTDTETDGTVVVTLRVERGLVATADAIAEAANKSPRIGKATRTDVLRAAIAEGLRALSAGGAS